MKKLIALSMLAIATNANAWNIENVAALDPDIIVKGGVGDNDNIDRTVALTLALETNLCNRYKHCFNPFAILFKNNAGTNYGIGLDYVYKFNKQRNYAEPYAVPGNNFFVMLGAALFIEPLNHIDGEYFNYHVGVGYEVNRVVVSLDAYGDPSSEREAAQSQVLLNIGYRF